MPPRRLPTIVCAFITLASIAVGSTLLARHVSSTGGSSSSLQASSQFLEEQKEHPSPTPSSIPSFEPSDIPSNVPSANPSDVPSSTPSSKPSNRPSSKPSLRPTASPSASPSSTPSSAPTRMPVSPNYGFRLKLFWNNYFWQEEDFDQEWCLECASCFGNKTELDTGEGCVPSSSGGGGGKNSDLISSCSDGDQLWVQKCGNKKGNAVFNLIQGEAAADQIKVQGTNLCLERYNSRRIVLSTCEEGKMRQRWVGFRMDAPFELRPIQHLERCVTQHHHPKGKELIYTESCRLAHHYDTGYWETF